jgi:beta-glucosidase
MKQFILFISVVISLSLSAQNNQIPVYKDHQKPIEERIEDALKRMTLEEKVALCHAQSKFSSAGVPRLGIPENWMTDGPHGIRAETLWDDWSQAKWTNDSCIAFPALTCLAATWNKDMSLLYGKSIGEEARFRNKNVLLGPGVNIYRTPLNGRNFEYMGEDPFLASMMVVPYIKGVQQNGVAACVKHFALNNQERNRNKINVTIDDRALYEIYLPAFKAAVQKGQTWAIMGSYNKYKGQWTTHNKYLMNDILRGEWKFDGVVVSDWGSVHDTHEAIYNGLDMEFGTGTNGLDKNTENAYKHYYLATPFLNLLQSGKVKEEEVDKKVRNILRLIFRTNMSPNRPWGSFGTEEHAQASIKIAEEGIVLLQNQNNLLPLDLNKHKKILVVGENAIKMMTFGGGSSSLKTKYEVLPLDGIKNRIGDKAEVIYARGYVGSVLSKQDGVDSGQDLKDERSTKKLIDEASNLAKDADVVIFIGGLNKSMGQDSEGADRRIYHLPYNQNDIISKLLESNKNLVYVNISGNAVEMPWVKDVPAIVQSWYNGTEAGNALASILLGDVNPSGKLPFTINEKLEDYGAHSVGDYPGENNEETYNEGLFVGYRWNEKEKINPLFSFGHGLSYTTFEYGQIKADKKAISVNDNIIFSIKIKNSGKKEGAEIVQLYIADLESSLPRPVKELKGFEKINLKPGEEKTVSFKIDKVALSFFDNKKHDWVAEPGDFEVLIGASSSDIKGKMKFTLK